MLSQEQKNHIVNTLTQRFQNNGVRCPMCGDNHFIIADAYFNNQLQDELTNINLRGPSIPTISIICDRCGFVSQHSLGVLGLIPIANNENGDNNVSDNK